MEVLETLNPRRHCGMYRVKDWHERDNFPTLEAAHAYASIMARTHTVTPYRIVRLARRSYPFAVQYIPAHLLRH